MKRKLLIPGLSYFLGMFLRMQGFSLAASAVICAAALLVMIGLRIGDKRAVTGFAVFFMAANAVFSVYTFTVYDRAAALDDKTVNVTGTVKDITEVGSDKVLVKVKGSFDGVDTTASFYCKDIGIDYGDRINAKVKVSKITDNIFYQGETYNRPEGIFISGEEAETVFLTDAAPDYFLRGVMHFRDRVYSQVTNVIGGDEGAFAAAMLCGDKTDLSNDAKNLIYRSGLGHIFCVSGTHVLLVGVMIYELVRKIRLGKKITFAISLVLVWLFALMAGMTAPVVRSCIMMTALMSAELFHRKSDPANAACGCMLIMLTVSPYAAGSRSFLLSFTAVFAMSVFAPELTKRLKSEGFVHSVEVSALTSLTMLVVSMPFQLLFFDELSVIAPLTNILLVPLCVMGLTVVFVSAIGIPLISVPLLTAAKYIMRAVFKAADLLCRPSLSYLPSRAGITAVVIIITLAAVYLICFISRSARAAVVSSLCAMIVWSVTAFFGQMMPDKDYKLVILPSGSKLQCVLYSGSEGVIFDISANGSLDNTTSRLLSRVGIRDVRCEFVTKKPSLTVTRAMTDLSYKPECFYVFDECLNERAVLLEGLSKVSLGDAQITASREGFLIDVKGKRIGLYTDHVEYNGTAVLTDEETLPIVLEPEKDLIRRTDYAFSDCG
ncbi:MAG: ComEC/Rec2 family competence protein [Ruminococcus sp.]|nr:ComEC/Rec2 family competence protein [Ruminococcus sp.]